MENSETKNLSTNGIFLHAESVGENPLRYTTSRGYVLEFLSIPALLQKLTRQYHKPAPPTYQVTTATGAVETHAHDATTLETDADRAAWQAYQEQLAKTAGDLFTAQLRLCYLRGMRIVSAPGGSLREANGTDLDAWVKEQEFIGFEIPTDPLERQVHFLETEVAPSAEDTISILAGVSRASGVDQEVVAQLEASFRGALGLRRGGDAGRTDGAAAAERGGVEPVGAVSGNGNGRRENEDAPVDVGLN